MAVIFRNIVALVLFALYFTCANAYLKGFGFCPDYECNKNFSFSQLAGKWLIDEEVGYPKQHCNYIEFSESSENAMNVTFTKQAWKYISVKEFGVLVREHHGGLAYLKPDPISRPEYTPCCVLFISESSCVVYNCEQRLFYKKEWGFIMTREGAWSPEGSDSQKWLAENIPGVKFNKVYRKDCAADLSMPPV